MTVSLVPRTDDIDVCLVLDELKTHGQVWREIDGGLANEATVIEWIIEGQFNKPVQIVAFHTAEGWSRDVTEDIAGKLLDLNRQGTALGEAARDFVERVTGERPIVAV
jgi:hypothetical protein